MFFHAEAQIKADPAQPSERMLGYLMPDNSKIILDMAPMMPRPPYKGYPLLLLGYSTLSSSNDTCNFGGMQTVPSYQEPAFSNHLTFPSTHWKTVSDTMSYPSSDQKSFSRHLSILSNHWKSFSGHLTGSSDPSQKHFNAMTGCTQNYHKLHSMLHVCESVSSLSGNTIS